MSKATFGKPRPDKPQNNNGGTVIYGKENGVVTQSFGRKLLTAQESSSLDEINAVYTVTTNKKVINYFTGKYVDDLTVTKDNFITHNGNISHGGAFSSAFSNDFGG